VKSRLTEGETLDIGVNTDMTIDSLARAHANTPKVACCMIR
jgi:hypothetical protein